MKKFLSFILLIGLLFLLASCQIKGNETIDAIRAPENITPPLSGEWVIKNYKMGNFSTMGEDIARTYLGKEVLFHKDLVAIGDEYCMDPIYKIKNVNPVDYLIYQYKTSPKFLDIDKDEIQIVSVISNEQFFYEFIKESEDTIIVNIDGVFFYLELVSEDIKDEKLAEYNYKDKAMLRIGSVEADDIPESTILIGLKSLDKDDNNLEKWNYRTILIHSYNKEVKGIYEMEDIFLPRKTGFWKLGVERTQDVDIVEDNISVYPLKRIAVSEQKNTVKNGEDTLIEEEILDKNLLFSIKEEKPIKKKTLKNILYAGNDYISLETVNYLEKGERILEFHLIDNVDKENPIKISDIAGEIGRTSFLEEANKEILSKNEKYKDSTIDLVPDEESFGLFRRNGYWIFKGRVNFLDNGVYSYKDFNIRAIPPKEVVHFDQLAVPWNAIKTKVPEAVDAFTSPNEDIALIVTHNNILVYTIDNGDISDIPLKKIQLKSAEKVIMSEWGLDRYAPIWEEEFLKSGGIEIEK